MMTPEERERERTLFQAEREKYPHLFVREPMTDDNSLLASIGIEGLRPDRPAGYLRLMPQDFIVEEISQDSAIHTVDINADLQEVFGTDSTIYCDLVKIGTSTLEIKDHLASLLDIEDKYIGYAGIKDRVALTGQAISIRGAPRLDALRKISQEENFFLKNCRRGKGAIANGDLWGNRFIITVRTTSPLSSNQTHFIKNQSDEINETGFWNYFYIQRFGTPRLISHRLGLLIARGQYEETVKMFLTHTSERELPYFKNIRDEIKAMWGNWPEIIKRIELFPYHFHLELTLIRHLAGHPANFLGALCTIPDQIRIWIYAYDSYLFNKKLSELIATGEVPLSLPLATSFNRVDWEPYQKFLQEDEVKMPTQSWRDFPFVRVASRAWPTLQEIKIHSTEFRDNLAIFVFSLPKGTYATTYLMNFFILSSGLPLPPGISTEQIDAKATVGLGSLAGTLERFRTVLEQRQQDIDAGSQE